MSRFKQQGCFVKPEEECDPCPVWRGCCVSCFKLPVCDYICDKYKDYKKRVYPYDEVE